MLLSRRRHYGPQQSRAEVGRAIAARWLTRSVRLAGVTQDERLTFAAVQQDVARPRTRAMLVLRGACQVTVRHEDRTLAETHHLPAGTVFVAGPGRTLLSRVNDAEVLELEWEAPEQTSNLDGAAKATPGMMRAGETLSRDLLADTSPVQVTSSLRTFQETLCAAGANPEGMDDVAPCSRSQRLMEAIDAQLSALGSAPMMVDLCSALHASTRTLTRRILALHEAHQLTGRGRTWREQRDTYRLVIATLFATEPNTSPRELAAIAGYGSVEALDHAFRNAGLPPPGALRSQVRAGS